MYVFDPKVTGSLVTRQRVPYSHLSVNFLNMFFVIMDLEAYGALVPSYQKLHLVWFMYQGVKSNEGSTQMVQVSVVI